MMKALTLRSGRGGVSLFCRSGGRRELRSAGDPSSSSSFGTFAVLYICMATKRHLPQPVRDHHIALTIVDDAIVVVENVETKNRQEKGWDRLQALPGQALQIAAGPVIATTWCCWRCSLPVALLPWIVGGCSAVLM